MRLLFTVIPVYTGGDSKQTLACLLELQIRKEGGGDRASLPSGSPALRRVKKAAKITCLAPLRGQPSLPIKLVHKVNSRLRFVTCQEDGMFCLSLRGAPQLLKRLLLSGPQM